MLRKTLTALFLSALLASSASASQAPDTKVETTVYDFSPIPSKPVKASQGRSLMDSRDWKWCRAHQKPCVRRYPTLSLTILSIPSIQRARVQLEKEAQDLGLLPKS